MDKQHPSIKLSSTALKQEKSFSTRPPTKTTAASDETTTTAKTNKQAKIWMEQLDQHLLGTKNSHLAPYAPISSTGFAVFSTMSPNVESTLLTSQAEAVEPEPVVPLQEEVAAYSEVLPYFLTLKLPFALTVLHFLCS